MNKARKDRRVDFSKDRRYLEESMTLRVRFHEVDSMRIVWHGHYFTYFEEARQAFGRKYNMDYPVFLENSLGAPLVHFWIDFLAPARMNDEIRVVARLFESEGAELRFGYEIRNVADERRLATGGSIQVFTTLQGELILTPPALMQERYKQWAGLWKTQA